MLKYQRTVRMSLQHHNDFVPILFGNASKIQDLLSKVF